MTRGSARLPDAFDTTLCCVGVSVAWWAGTALFELWHLTEDTLKQLVVFEVD